MKSNQKSVNDISLCLKDAQVIASRIKHIRRSDRDFFAAFHALAGDEITGFLAYVIWRSRSIQHSGLR
jgi:hypothetical protein